MGFYINNWLWQGQNANADVTCEWTLTYYWIQLQSQWHRVNGPWGTTIYLYLACLFASPPLSLSVSRSLSLFEAQWIATNVLLLFWRTVRKMDSTLILVEGNGRCSGSVRTCSGISTQNQGTETLLFSMCLVVKSKSTTRWWDRLQCKMANNLMAQSEGILWKNIGLLQSLTWDQPFWGYQSTSFTLWMMSDLHFKVSVFSVHFLCCSCCPFDTINGCIVPADLKDQSQYGVMRNHRARHA